MEAAAGERIRLQPSAVADALRDSVQFRSIPHVELAIRPLRQVLLDKDATPESRARAALAAEALALIGMRQFAGGKKSALIFILYGCFLIEITGAHVRGCASSRTRHLSLPQTAGARWATAMSLPNNNNLSQVLVLGQGPQHALVYARALHDLCEGPRAHAPRGGRQRRIRHYGPGVMCARRTQQSLPPAPRTQVSPPCRL